MKIRCPAVILTFDPLTLKVHGTSHDQILYEIEQSLAELLIIL